MQYGNEFDPRSAGYRSISEVYRDLEMLVECCTNKLTNPSDKLIAKAAALSIEIHKDPTKVEQKIDDFLARLGGSSVASSKDWFLPSLVVSEILSNVSIYKDNKLFDLVVKHIDRLSQESFGYFAEILQLNDAITQIVSQKDYTKLNILLDHGIAPQAIARPLCKWCEYNFRDISNSKQPELEKILRKLIKGIDSAQAKHFKIDATTDSLREELAYQFCCLLTGKKFGQAAVSLLAKAKNPVLKGKILGTLVAKLSLDAETESAYLYQSLEIADQLNDELRESFVSSFITSAVKHNPNVVEKIHGFFDEQLARSGEEYYAPSIWIARAQRSFGDQGNFLIRRNEIFCNYASNLYKDNTSGTLDAKVVRMNTYAQLLSEEIIAEAQISGNTHVLMDLISNCIDAAEKNIRENDISWKLAISSVIEALNNLGLQERALELAIIYKENEQWTDLLYSIGVSQLRLAPYYNEYRPLIPSEDEYMEACTDLYMPNKMHRMLRKLLVPLLFSQHTQSETNLRSLTEFITESEATQSRDYALATVKHVSEIYRALKKMNAYIE